MDETTIHLYLDSILKLRPHCQREDASGETIQEFLRLSLMFVRDIMTDDVFRRAMRTAENGQGLLLLANRVAQLEPLLADEWPEDFTFSDLKEELFAIANGDAPRIIKSEGKQGRFRNAHALLERKLECRGWYKVLGELDVRAAERQALVMECYGISNDAFQKWRQEAKDKLGSDYVERFLHDFVRLNTRTAKLQTDPVAWGKLQCLAGGTSYKQKLAEAR